MSAHDYCLGCDGPLTGDDHRHGRYLCAACAKKSEEARGRLREFEAGQAAHDARMLELTRKIANNTEPGDLRGWVVRLEVENRDLDRRVIELEMDLEESREQAKKDEEGWRADCVKLRNEQVRTFNELYDLRQRWYVKLFRGY